MTASLANGGFVNWTGTGIAYIDDPIVIPSNTHLKVSPTLEIRLTGSGTARNMLVNSGYVRQAAGYLAATLTWTAGRNVSIARTAHGLTVGQFVTMWSSNLSPSNFIGTFPVITVTDADNFIVRMHRTPTTSPTGTAQYILADTNITVEGGIWDQNYPSNGFGVGPANHAVIIGCAAHVRTRDMKFKNVAKYCVMLGGVYDYGADGISADNSNSDVVKVYGPAVAGFARNIQGYTDDDIVSIQGKEAAAFSTYMWIFGDVHNFEVENITGQTTSAGTFTCYYSVNEYTGSIRARRVGGSGASWGVAITAGYSNSVMDDIIIDGVNSAGPSTLKVNANGFTGSVINRIESRGWRFEPDTYASNRQGVVCDANVTINEMTFFGAEVNNSTWPGAATYMMAFNSVIGTFNLIGGRFTGVGSNARLAQFTGGVTTVNMSHATIAASAWGEVFNFSTGTPTINVFGNDLNGTGAVVGTTVACTVNLNGNRINVGANGVVRANAAVTINIRSAANNWVAGVPFTNGSATGDWRVYGWDMPVNLNTTGVTKTTAGQFCLSTTLAGTIVANRLAHCNGTNFLQLDTPANIF